jgi:hypothetical protein
MFLKNIMDIDEKELVYYKTKKAFRDFIKSYQKVADLEELYYRIDNEEVLAELETAKEELKVTELPVEEAKQNILNKTRRGRKSKN